MGAVRCRGSGGQCAAVHITLALSCTFRHTHLEVVGAHEEVSNAGAHHAHDPLVKVGGLALGHRVQHLGLYAASEALDLDVRGGGRGTYTFEMYHAQPPGHQAPTPPRPPHLVLLVQRRDVVLERVGHPPTLEPHIGDALQGVPRLVARAQGCDEERGAGGSRSMHRQHCARGAFIDRSLPTAGHTRPRTRPPVSSRSSKY